MHTTRIATLSLLAALTACAPRTDGRDFAGSPGVSSVSERLIGDRAVFIDSWSDDDVDATATFFTGDAVLRVDDRTMRGTSAVRAWLAQELPGIVSLRIDEHEFDPSEEEVVERGRYTVTVQPPGEDTLMQSGTYRIEWSQVGDDFRIDEMIIDSDM